MNDLIGKTLLNEKDEQYLILKVIDYKGIKCAYAMKVMNKDEEGEKSIFQLNENRLVTINSKKMINELTQMLIDSKDIVDKPRKIKKDESIKDYMKYLDEYYKTRVVTIM